MSGYSIMVATQKGGVGKTVTSLALFAELQQRGYKTLLIDCDPQRNASMSIPGVRFENVGTLYDIFFSPEVPMEKCIQKTEYGDVIASDSQIINLDGILRPSVNMYNYLRKSLSGIKDQYDFIIFDTPPAMGIANGNVLMSATEDFPVKIIIPVEAELYSISGLSDFYNSVCEYKSTNPNIDVLGILRVKYKPRTKITQDIDAGVLPKMAERLNTKIFETTIRESVRVKEALSMRMSLLDFSPTCTAALDYANLTEELLEDLHLPAWKEGGDHGVK